MRTLEAFAAFSDEIVVVLPQSHQQLWSELCVQYHCAVGHRVVQGGATRWQSVRNAIDAIDVSLGDVIAVQDGVRPLVSGKLIERAFTMARKHGSAVPVVPVTDSIRQVESDGTSHILPREELRAVQTPQVFDAIALKAAYELPYQAIYTDDASVYEMAGHHVTVVDGETANIKITHPGDLMFAESLLSHEQ